MHKISDDHTSNSSLDLHCLLTEKQAADLLSLSPKTLQKYRIIGNGPKYYKINKSIRYAKKHLIEYLEPRLVKT